MHRINQFFVIVTAVLLVATVGCDGESLPPDQDGEPRSNINFVDSSLANLSAINYADVDQDGDVDIVAASTQGDMYWYKNNSGEGFAESLIATGLYNSYDIDIVDFNHDGHLDIVTFDKDRNIILLKGSWEDGAQGEFEREIVMAPGIACYPYCELEVADFNNDSILDFIYCGVANCHLIIFSDSEKNTFSKYTQAATTYVTNLKAADINGDGWVDYSYAAFSQLVVETALNIGGTNKFRRNSVWVEHAYGAAAVQDVNLDGVVDIVGTQSIHLGIESGINWRVEHNSLRFSFPLQATDIPVSYYASSFAVVDIDSDGDNDIVSMNRSGSYYWLENGAGKEEDALPGFRFDPRGAKGFLQLIPFDGITPSRPIRITDIDGDGELDIISNQLVDGKIMWANIQHLIANPYIVTD